MYINNIVTVDHSQMVKVVLTAMKAVPWALMYVDMVDPRRYNSLSSKYSRVFVLACRQFFYAFFFSILVW